MPPPLRGAGRLWGQSSCTRACKHAASNQGISYRSHIAQRRLSTSSGSSTVSAKSSVVPRSKRLSYADADRVYSSGKATTESFRWQQKSSHADSISAAISSSSSAASPASLRTRLQQRWMTVLIGLMRTPYLGALTMRVLEAAAYVAYVKGAVMIFTRRRVGPPLAMVKESDVSFNEENLCGGGRTAHSQGSPSHCEDSLSREDALLASSRPSPPAGGPSAADAAWRSSSHDSPLGEDALDCLYVGDSPIHSRGIFTARALPRGTRIIAETRRSLLLAPHFVTLLADTHERLPDTWHYTQPTGSVVELVTRAQPHHLMNHSCRANVCSGLSHTFWEAATIAAEWQQHSQQSGSTGGGGSSSGSERVEDLHGSPMGGGVDGGAGKPPSWVTAASVAAPSHSADWMERLTRWPFFADANSFFLTRDVEAGEELTLNYSTRMAPLCVGASACMMQSRNWLLCQCGQPCCRHYVYRPKPEVSEFLRALHARQYKEGRSARLPRRHSTSGMSGGTAASNTMGVWDPVHVMAKLLELGFDDELVLLSYAASSADIVAYVYGQPLPSLQRRSTTLPGVSSPPLSPWLARAPSTVQEGIVVELRRVSKRHLLSDYRHVFRRLNETAPRRA
ncbi:hypothetical protein JKF63_07472 [Porcisia hertigi]|uniref:SET domain-containing protein n=1 Tax=Porcisia hertigi TaxID=2761500 RepID=A0A836LGE5_9TRYP|nr:hypothetical protein JKF63_07472 [Porcisia hertigi]